MSDRALLELAAKAAGLTLTWSTDPILGTSCSVGHADWNPLTDDGDALRLASTLKLNIMQGEFSVAVGDEDEIDEAAFVPDESQRLFAIRESIVRAAAEIGKAMQ